MEIFEKWVSIHFRTQYILEAIQFWIWIQEIVSLWEALFDVLAYGFRIIQTFSL